MRICSIIGAILCLVAVSAGHANANASFDRRVLSVGTPTVSSPAGTVNWDDIVNIPVQYQQGSNPPKWTNMKGTLSRLGATMAPTLRVIGVASNVYVVGLMLKEFWNAVKNPTWSASSDGSILKPGVETPATEAFTRGAAYDWWIANNVPVIPTAWTPVSGTNTTYHMMESKTAADAAATAMFNTYTWTTNSAHKVLRAAQDMQPSAATADKLYQREASAWLSTSGAVTRHFYIYSLATSPTNPVVTTPAQSGDPVPITEADVMARLNELGATQADVLRLLQEWTKQVDYMLKNPQSTAAKTPWPQTGSTSPAPNTDTRTEVETQLKSWPSESTWESIGSPSTNPLEGDTVIEPGASADYGPFSANPYARPEINDFPARMQQFFQDMKATSIFGLPGQLVGGIPNSSTCEMSINLGESLGGQQTVSFCAWASWLAALRAVLLIVGVWIAVRIVVLKGE